AFGEANPEGSGVPVAQAQVDSIQEAPPDGVPPGEGEGGLDTHLASTGHGCQLAAANPDHLERPNVAAKDRIGVAIPWPSDTALVGRRAGCAAAAWGGWVAGVDRRAASQQRMGGGAATVILQ